MARKVRQETIDRIAKMGMAKSLKHAHDNDDPEFREAVKRYYPNAKYGPKTKAAAEANSTPAPASTPASPPIKNSVSRGSWTKTSFGTPSFMNKRVTGAVARKVEGSSTSRNTSRNSNRSQRNNLAGRQQNKGIGVVDAIVDRHRSLDKKFKKTNPKVKSAIAGFFTGDNKQDKEKRRKAAQRPRS